MNSKINLILITLFGVLLHQTYGQNCKRCMSTNDAYCVDETTYYLCMDGNHLTNTLHTCPVDHVCTDSENVCEPKVKSDGTTNVAACSTGCSKCPDSTAVNKRYTCVSKTQYGRCANGEVTIVSTCEGDSLCSSELYATTGKICSPQCVIDFFGVSNTCTNDEITTTSTTAAPGTTPSVQTLRDQCVAAQVPNKKYFYIRNKDDADCKTYIYCETIDNVMEALLIRCSSGYFDSTTSRCIETKPSECTVTPAPTTQSTNTAAPSTQSTNTAAPSTQSTNTAAPSTQSTNSAAPSTQATDPPAPTQSTDAPTPSTQATDAPVDPLVPTVATPPLSA